MKLAITDACIFIDLIELKLTSEFFELELEMHTSLDVFNELNPEQKEILKAYQSVGKLSVHNISSKAKAEIQSNPYPNALSEPDKTVIFLAKQINAMILSSDKAVRKYSKKQAVEYHGLLWIFDRLIQAQCLSPKVAILKIDELVKGNIMYNNNAELYAEIKKRKKLWNES